MKTIISSFLIVIYLISTSYGQDNLQKDLLSLYSSDIGASLLNALKVYDNDQMKGEPAFIINVDGIKANKEFITFKDALNCKKSNLSSKNDCLLKYYDIANFVQPSLTSVRMIVEDKNGVVGRVIHRKRNYYFQLKKDDFKGGQWPENSLWKLVDNDEARALFLDLKRKDLTFLTFFEKVKKCISKKDVNCLSNLEKTDNDKSEVERMFKYRAIAESPTLCLLYTKAGGFNNFEMLDEIIKENKVKDSNIVWRNLERVLTLDKNEVSLTIRMKDFDNVSSVNFKKKIKGKLPCENDIDMEISLSKGYKSDESWRIGSFDTFAQNDEGVTYDEK